jgi:hypothetical protein
VRREAYGGGAVLFGVNSWCLPCACAQIVLVVGVLNCESAMNVLSYFLQALIALYIPVRAFFFCDEMFHGV